MKLQFIGGVREVTGSCHLLDLGEHKCLLDCGLQQNRGLTKTPKFPFDPKEIECVFLSHAHIDHSGLLPFLVHQGFSGTIYSTPATRDVTQILLLDSVKIQKEEKKETLYSVDEVLQTMNLFEVYNYETSFYPLPILRVVFYNAGHIRGRQLQE